MMSAAQLRASLRARAMKKRQAVSAAAFGKPEPAAPVGELQFYVIERDSAGKISEFTVRSPDGVELRFGVTERDGVGRVRSFKVGQ